MLGSIIFIITLCGLLAIPILSFNGIIDQGQLIIIYIIFAGIALFTLLGISIWWDEYQ